MMLVIENDTDEQPGGWTIEHGVLRLFGFDSDGKAKQIIE